jgi:hypothetical protein
MEGIRRIEALIGQIEALADPETRSTVRELVSAILEYHGEGFARVLEIVQDPVVIHALGRDEVAGSLLLLYGLHPEDFDTRVRRAVDGIPHVELLGTGDNVVHLRAMGSGPVSREAVEQLIFAAAPETAAVEIEGLAPAAFVPLESLIRVS